MVVGVVAAELILFSFWECAYGHLLMLLLMPSKPQKVTINQYETVITIE